MQDGGMVATRGYWGDIVNSPYLSFGVQSKCQDLFNGKTTSVSLDCMFAGSVLE